MNSFKPFPEKLDLIDIDFTALADAIKAGRKKRTLENCLKRGTSPVLSLSGVISASLVSAAAKELDEDPLAGLATVDDLSAFSEEICLPASAYAGDEPHDHEQYGRLFSHAGSHGRPFYLDDPFASQYATGVSAPHAGHQSRLVGVENVPSLHGSMHSQHSTSVTGAMSPSGQHGAGHNGHAVAQQTRHHVESPIATADTAHTGHGGDDAALDSASAHAGHHVKDVAQTVHAGHNAPAAPAHEMHVMHSDEHDELTGFINALTHDLNMVDTMEVASSGDLGDASGADMTGSSSQPAVATPHGHHHELSLAGMDAPPPDDLSAAQAAPVI